MIRHKMKRIQKKLHRTGAFGVCKISLSFFDDKRYILDDGINYLAYFHKDRKVNEIDRINKMNKINETKESCTNCFSFQ